MTESFRRVTLGAALASTVALTGCSGDTATIELNEEQTAIINQDIRLGRFGLAAYTAALASQTDAEQIGDITRLTISNLDTFAEGSVPLGAELQFSEYLAALDGKHASDESVFKPYNDEAGAYILYENSSGNITYDASASALFFNPDENFFGADEVASPSEINSFYDNPGTVAVNVEYYSDDVLNGIEDYRITYDHGRFDVSMKNEDEIELTPSNAVEVIKDEFFF